MTRTRFDWQEPIRERGHLGKRGPNGRPLCAWCGTEVPKGRRKWCSAECAEAPGAYLTPRMAALTRDQGVCRQCGTDTEGMKRAVHTLRRHGQGKWVAKHLRRHGFNPDQSFWQADHVVPLAEGGKHAPSNIQTLCVPCHKAKTAEQAARMAYRRRHGDPGSLRGRA